MSLVKGEPQGGGKNRNIKNDNDDERDCCHCNSESVCLRNDVGDDFSNNVDGVECDDGVVDATDLSDELNDAEASMKRVHVAMLALMVQSNREQDGSGSTKNSLSDLHHNSIGFVHFVRVKNERQEGNE